MFGGAKLKFKKPARYIVGAGLVVLMVGSGAAAWASETYQNYSATLPRFQGGWDSPHDDIKGPYLDDGGHIYVTSVGTGYTVNARLCDPNGAQCSYEVDGLGSASSAILANAGYVQGFECSLLLHENPWSVYQVSSKGSWNCG
jgi:hypothetical protein